MILANAIVATSAAMSTVALAIVSSVAVPSLTSLLFSMSESYLLAPPSESKNKFK